VSVYEAQKGVAGSERHFPEREKQGSAHAPSGFATDGEPRLAAMQDGIASQVFPAAPMNSSTAVREMPFRPGRDRACFVNNRDD
jgi:hypothetical protein